MWKRNMSPLTHLKHKPTLKYTIIISCRLLSSSLQYTKLSNYEATRLINELNIRHKNNSEHMDKTIKESFEIYLRVNKTEIDNYLINSLLQLWWDYRNAIQIFEIWNDIEQYHKQNNYTQQQLSYSSIMKCLLFPDNIDISKCMQTLQWMENARYCLCIHDAFLNKLILKCGQQKDINVLKYIHHLMKRNIIETKKRILGNNTTLITAYGICECISDALNVFNSISDNKKDIVIIGAMMKVLLDSNYNEQVLELYDKYQSMHLHNHITHILGIKAAINVNDFEKGLEIKNNISDDDYKNIRIQTTLIDFYGHFNDTINALNLFKCIDDKQLNAVCIGSIMKALIDNGLNERALEIYDKYTEINNNVNHLLAIKAAGNDNNFEKGILIHENIDLCENNNNYDTMLLSVLIDFYGKFGKINEAEKLFNILDDKHKNIGLIDCMMTVYINNGGNKQALYLYDKCKEFHDDISHVLALKACINA
eukprot:152528_1